MLSKYQKWTLVTEFERNSDPHLSVQGTTLLSLTPCKV